MNDTAPIGPYLNDIAWAREVAEKHSLIGMDIPLGSIILDNTTVTGGRTFCYPDGKWLIGISLRRFQLVGKEGMEGILAHELLHAWLWCIYGYEQGHDELFKEKAAMLDIPLRCSSYEEVVEQGQTQLALL